MEEVEAKFKIRDIQDDGNEEKVGYGIIADASQVGLDNLESGLFFEDAFNHGCLGLTRNTAGDLTFSRADALQWLSEIDRAMMVIFALCHITTISGRGTEAAALRPTNSHAGRRNIVFDPIAKTGAFDTDYHKGQRITGKPKHLHRHVPWEVFRLLYVMIRLIRPLELWIACGTIVLKPAQELKIQDAYANHVWASFGVPWDTDKMSKSLGLFFKDLTKANIGLQLYRHLGIALQRQFINFGSQKTPEAVALEETMHRLSGHEKDLADDHYARQVPLGTGSADERERSRIVSGMWHTVLGFPTGYDKLVPGGEALMKIEVVSKGIVGKSGSSSSGQRHMGVQSQETKAKKYGQLQDTENNSQRPESSTGTRRSSRKASAGINYRLLNEGE